MLILDTQSGKCRLPNYFYNKEPPYYNSYESSMGMFYTVCNALIVRKKRGLPAKQKTPQHIRDLPIDGQNITEELNQGPSGFSYIDISYNG
ncbi:hypothetical protein K449DRAFT_435093 [Hypoxylon sp. EC38]|nr:hypothetical protein K449DRAFT_435093 [Hypoxylon sp. EC38]